MLSRAAIFEKLQHPRIAAILACLLTLDLVYLTAQPSGIGVLLRGEITTQRWCRLVSGGLAWNAPWYVLVRGRRHILIDAERDGPLLARQSTAVQPRDVLEVIPASPLVYHLWAQVFEVPQVRVKRLDGSAPEPIDRDIAIQLVADRVHVRADEAAVLATLPRIGCGDSDPGERSKMLEALAREMRISIGGMPRVLWWGVLHNVAGLAGMVMLGVSLAGMPRWVRLQRFGAMECRGCGYDMRGIGGAKCPECGRER